MAWKIEFARSAEKELSRIESQASRRILRFLKERVANDPRSVGEPLKGELSDFWRYRVGDYRLYATIYGRYLLPSVDLSRLLAEWQGQEGS